MAWGFDSSRLVAGSLLIMVTSITSSCGSTFNSSPPSTSISSTSLSEHLVSGTAIAGSVALTSAIPPSYAAHWLVHVKPTQTTPPLPQTLEIGEATFLH